MSSQTPQGSTPSPPLDADIEQEIRRGRRFSIADAIAQSGGDFLKGESPVPKLVQVKNELLGFIGAHLQDSSGALLATLRDLIQSDDVVCSRHFDAPLCALEALLTPILVHEAYLHEFVRQVDMRWGRMYDERPRFQKPEQPPHPDDEYTHESVRSQLEALLLAVRQHQT